jgi:CHAT domain-containing protein
MLSRPDGEEEPASTTLFSDVFSEALSALPPDIDRLILVPDGPLHHLPFDALRPAAGAVPLGQRYEIVVTPSAALWLEWRRHPPAPSNRRVLALADPALGTDRPAAAERHVVLEQGANLGRLPHARRESRAIRRLLGGVDALVGPFASEHVIKTRVLRHYGIVHFAAHAVADEEHPERSAVFLAPGSAEEDGLLQGREIADLDLDGRIVVLSACQTASGAVLTGEGVLSLARAFFAAGARAVVGTRWPIRDDDAAALFESFYRHLAQGTSLSSALRHARMEAIAAGVPARAWAALVVVGDGSMQPFPAGPSGRISTSWTLALGGLVLGAAVIALGRRRH